MERSLYQAVSQNLIQEVEKLVDGGANVNEKVSYFHRTPLHVASSLGFDQMVELLISKGANIVAKDTQDCTPLHIAIKTNRKEIVDLLIKHDAEINAKGFEGLNSLQLGNKDAARIFQTTVCS